MMSYIILNGVKSNAINGLLISKLPPITKPPIKTRVDEIEGRDGDIVTPIGYGAYDKTMEIGLYGDYDIDEIIKFFDSSGTVTFSNESDKYYRYQIIEKIDFERLVRFRTATITFHVQPFKYSLVDTEKTFLIDNQILNIGDYTITKNGITITSTNGVILVSGTASEATEIYFPITPATLTPANYALNATANGLGASICDFGMMYTSEDPPATPTAANTFGGNLTQLQNNKTVSIKTTISWTQTFNYIYFHFSTGVNTNFAINFFLENTDENDLHIINNGNIESKPTITIYGAGTINFEINDFQVLKIELGNEGNITINAEKMEAYKDGILKNRLVTGNYENLKFNVGKNLINTVGEVSRIEIENYSRWI